MRDAVIETGHDLARLRRPAVDSERNDVVVLGERLRVRHRAPISDEGTANARGLDALGEPRLVRPQLESEACHRAEMLRSRKRVERHRRRRGERPTVDERPSKQTGRGEQHDDRPRGAQSGSGERNRVARAALLHDDEIPAVQAPRLGGQVGHRAGSLPEGAKLVHVNVAADLCGPAARGDRYRELVHIASPAVAPPHAVSRYRGWQLPAAIAGLLDPYHVAQDGHGSPPGAQPARSRRR